MSGSKLFGMPANAGRWLLVLLGLSINICLGAVYAYSVFKKPLEALFNIGATQSNLPFMVFLAVFSIFTFLAGRFIDKLGPRNVMILGGIIVGIGWILTKYATGIGMVIFTYGVIGGAGVGIVYGGPVAVAARWFPDKKGLAVGLTLTGFGMSALITAPIAKNLIASEGVLPTFGLMGIAFLVIVVILSLPMRFPSPGWKPEGWQPPLSAGGAASVSFSLGEMVKTRAFFGVWLCYIIGTTAGLMAIGISAPVAREIVGLDAGTAAMLVSIFAIFNGGGRPFFGWLTDKITPRNSAILSFVIILLSSLGMLMAGQGSTTLYVLCFCGFWLCLGGWLAIGPTATATFFGIENYAQKYGLMFSAYGLGAIVGGIISGSAKDVFGSYVVAFKPTALLAVAGIVLAVVLIKPPKRI
ncbi:MAG: OFA family MFS transporter [Deltaproteobacteria bacterium]|nr:OFA family MFS transporter [Deltaproteobacteria bacterium]